jgi:hypothetical protein
MYAHHYAIDGCDWFFDGSVVVERLALSLSLSLSRY